MPIVLEGLAARDVPKPAIREQLIAPRPCGKRGAIFLMISINAGASDFAAIATLYRTLRSEQTFVAHPRVA